MPTEQESQAVGGQDGHDNDQQFEEIDDLRGQLESLKAVFEDDRKTEKSIQQKVIFAPRERKIEKFSGRQEDTTSTVYEFIDEISRCLKSRPSSEEEKVDLVLSHLEGPAKEELRYRPNCDKQTLKDVYNILTEVFGERCTVTELLSEFYQTKQDSKQTLQDYSHVLMCKLDKVFKVAPEASMMNRNFMLRDQFAENVKDAWLRRDLKRRIREYPDVKFSDLREEAIHSSMDSGEKPTLNKTENVSSVYLLESEDADTTSLEKLVQELREEVKSLREEVRESKIEKTVF